MEDLGHHGDAEVSPGLIDLSVNVRRAPMPDWLAWPIRAALDDLAAYPDPGPARAAVAARHRRTPEEVLVTSGAAEGFVLVARALRGIARRPLVVHPQFTEPEAALRHAGHDVDRVLVTADEGFRLDPARVPDDADLVVVGNPTNPTSVLHPSGAMVALARPGRVLVVDEAFADTTVADESLAGRPDLPGTIVVRSLTKTWGLAGLRIGYLLGPPDLIAALRRAQPLWAVSAPALAAAVACATPAAAAAERRIAAELTLHREHLVRRLRSLPEVDVPGEPASAFVLVRTPPAARLRERLRQRGYAVRRGDTFPGLGAGWLRIAVRDTATTDAFVDVLTELLGED